MVNSLDIFVRESDHLLVRGPCPWWSSRKLDALHHFQVCFLGLGWPVELPLIITLISPSGGRDDSSIFPFNVSSLWSRPRKFLNFPCHMRFSICCFKSKHSSISCPWSLWKRQYLFLLRLLGSPFIFSGHFKEGSSLICISTCSSGIFNEVYCWFRVEGPGFLLSRSFLSSSVSSLDKGPARNDDRGFLLFFQISSSS